MSRASARSSTRSSGRTYIRAPYCHDPDGLCRWVGRRSDRVATPAAAALLIVLILVLGGFGDVGAQGERIEITSPLSYQVVQRGAGSSTVVAVRASFGDAEADVAMSARAVVRAGMGGIGTDWTSMSAVDGSETGRFAVDLDLAVGWYDIEVRATRAGAVTDTATVAPFGVGEVFIMVGQSNAANHGRDGPETPRDPRVAQLDVAAGRWSFGDDPQPSATGTSGSAWPSFGETIAAAHRVPVGLVSVAEAATSVGEWRAGGALYNQRLLPAIEHLGTHGFRAILWHQGVRNLTNQPISATAYQAALEQIIAGSRVDAGWDVPWAVSLNAGGHPDTHRVAVGQQATIDADPLVYYGATVSDFRELGFGGSHYSSGGQQLLGQRFGENTIDFFDFDRLYPQVGDVNCTGSFDQADVESILALLVDPVDAVPECVVACDLDADGACRLTDAHVAARRLGGR